ncbi:MAG: M23 family metallopeptidase [Candidatus Cloacimonadota bacterium]|nr:M23 family metallopeptidase [Candidatus Cloacimonadota bacterium]
MNRFVNHFIFISVCIIFVIIGCSKEGSTIEIDPYIYIHGKIKKGESLYSELLSNNIDVTDAYKITNSLNKIYNLKFTHPNDSFLVKVDTLNQVQVLEFYPDILTKYIIKRDTTDNFISFKENIDYKKDIKFVCVNIETSLYEAFVDNGLNPELAMDLSDIFQWDIDFFIDTRKGDSCKIVYEVFENKNNKVLKYGNILATSYKGKNFDLTAYYYSNGNKYHSYYGKDGRSFQKAFLKSPLNYSFISSYFGMRLHPITKKYWLHNGVDYAARWGTPVQASCDGVVIHKGWKGGHPTPHGNTGGYGNTIMIRHANGYKTLYGHLSRYARGTKIGTRVKQHDIIGYVGSTGWSTGPHLHYTIYQYDKAINPLKLKNVSGPPIPKELRMDFSKVVSTMDKILQNEDMSIVSSI